MEVWPNHFQFLIVPCIFRDEISLSERIWYFAPIAMTAGVFAIVTKLEKRAVA
jgi:hypothetical protein